MEYLVLSLKLALGITFLFAGFTKLINIKDSSKFAENTGMFPKSVGSIMGFIMPFIEITIGILQCCGYSGDVLNLVTSFVILSFILLNLKAINENKEIACFCFGYIINTRLGSRGVYHYLLLLVINIPSFIWKNISIYDLLISNNFLVIFYILFAAVSLFITGIMIRITDLSKT